MALAWGIIDEAKAECVMSFESRSYFGFYKQGGASRVCRGYARGGFAGVFGWLCPRCARDGALDIEKGENSHHIWEAAYRAFGIALGEALRLDPEEEGPDERRGRAGRLYSRGGIIGDTV